MSLATGAVAVAARLLPVGMRDRYREQWMADLRDAAEAGVPERQIAAGALAFAATVARPLPWSATGGPTVRQRLRLSAALALSAALLSLSSFTSLWFSSGLTGTVGYDLALEMTRGVMLGFAIVAPIVAIVIVMRTKGAPKRVRVAVLLLAVVVLVPVARGIIDSYPLVDGELYVGLGGLAYLVGAIVVIVAARLLWTGLAVPKATPKRPVLWALAVFLAGAAMWVQAALAWSSRTPIVWSWQPGSSASIEDGKMIFVEIPVTQADYELWLAMKAQFELWASIALAIFALVVIALSLTVLSRRVPTVATALASIATLLIAHAALLGFFGWTVPLSAVLPEPMLAVGRLLLAGVILAAVGGLRLTRVRHRHDVEGAVELL